MKRHSIWLLLLLLAPGFGAAREVVGWVEKARIYPVDMPVKARVDTGARTTALGVDRFEYFERDNATWVRFSATNYKGRTVRLERLVYRTVRIKRDRNELVERPVIRLGICLGTIFQETEVSLEDRSHMNYQMLIGRNFLDGHFLVDPGAVFLNPPRCVPQVANE